MGTDFRKQLGDAARALNKEVNPPEPAPTEEVTHAKLMNQKKSKFSLK